MTGAPRPSSSGGSNWSRCCPARPGDTVLDVGCGTGLCLPLLRDKVGPTGTIVGIDASEQMLRGRRASRSPRAAGTTSGCVAAPAEQAPIDGLADAALFCAVHDVLQSRAALTRVLPASASRRRGGRGRREMARTGGCGRCGAGSPPCTHRSSPISPASTKPWRLLTEFVPDLRVQEHAFGAGLPGRGPPPPATDTLTHRTGRRSGFRESPPGADGDVPGAWPGWP